MKSEATFLSPTQVQCTAPPAAYAQVASVFVSSNGRTDPDQLSLGVLSFAYYNTPVISALENPYGPVQGGWKVLLRGNFFMDIPSLRCRYKGKHSDARASRRRG